MTPLLEVQDLKKYFSTPRGQLHAVDGISFTLEKGNICRDGTSFP